MARTRTVELNRAALKLALTAANVDFPAKAKTPTLQKLAEANDIPTTEEVELRGSIVPDHYKKLYGKEQNNGDELAQALKDHLTDKQGNCDVAALEACMIANGIEGGRWLHLNVGQRRMNFGNVLRGRLKNGEHVVVGSDEWNAPEKKTRKAKTAPEQAAPTEQAA